MDVTLIAETGRTTGSRPARRLRVEGKVPGVVYGLDREPVSVLVAWPELRRALTTEAGLNALITLDVDGQHDLTIVKDLQRDPVRRSVTHVDFLRIDRNASISVEVPVVLTGEAHQVEVEQGIVEQLLHTLLITSKPGRHPVPARGGHHRPGDRRRGAGQRPHPARGRHHRRRARGADRHRQRHPRRRGRRSRRGREEGAEGEPGEEAEAGGEASGDSE